jgi:hypothetical protein
MLLREFFVLLLILMIMSLVLGVLASLARKSKEVYIAVAIGAPLGTHDPGLASQRLAEVRRLE